MIGRSQFSSLVRTKSSMVEEASTMGRSSARMNTCTTPAISMTQKSSVRTKGSMAPAESLMRESSVRMIGSITRTGSTMHRKLENRSCSGKLQVYGGRHSV